MSEVSAEGCYTSTSALVVHAVSTREGLNSLWFDAPSASQRAKELEDASEVGVFVRKMAVLVGRAPRNAEGMTDDEAKLADAKTW